MKKLLFIILVLVSFKSTCFSQTTFVESSSQKFKFINTYAPREILWLNKMSFNVLNYSGEDKKINYYLDLAIKHRKKRNHFFLYGGLGLATGILGIIAASDQYIYPLILIGTLAIPTSFISGLIGGLTNDSKAKKNIGIAIGLQL